MTQATFSGLDNPPGNDAQGPVRLAPDVVVLGQQGPLGQEGNNPTTSSELVHGGMDMDF